MLRGVRTGLAPRTRRLMKERKPNRASAVPRQARTRCIPQDVPCSNNRGGRRSHKLLKEGKPEPRLSGTAFRSPPAAPAFSTSSAATAVSPAVPPSSEAQSPPSSGAAACSASRIARLWQAHAYSHGL